MTMDHSGGSSLNSTLNTEHSTFNTMMRKQQITEKKFDLEIEAIRNLIQAEARPFKEDKKEQEKRISRASKDMEYFGRTYFPHYIVAASSAFHRYICDRYPAMILKANDHRPEAGDASKERFETVPYKPVGDKQADAAPRGNAKSTWADLILVLWCAAFKY